MKHITIRNIEFINEKKDEEVLIKFAVKMPSDMSKEKIMDELQRVNGVKKVTGQ